MLKRDIEKLEKQLKSTEKQLSGSEKEREKLMSEMKGYKERSKALELELEQTRGFENSSLFTGISGYNTNIPNSFGMG